MPEGEKSVPDILTSEEYYSEKIIGLSNYRDYHFPVHLMRMLELH